MSHKWGWGLLLVFLAAAGVAFYLFYELPETAHPAADITDLSGLYSAEKEIAAARQELTTAEPAQVITADSSGSRQIALVLDGLPDRSTTARLLDLFQTHQIPVAFFVEGQNAAEQPETIKLLQESGQEIGNFTFVGIAAAQNLPQEELLGQLCRTQKVLETLTGQAPSLFRAPRTRFTEALLKAVTAAGIDKAVYANVVLPRGQLHSPADAAAFVSTIPAGSIVAIAAGDPVDVKKMEDGKTDDRPAIDKKPTIQTDESAGAQPADSLAEETEWLLSALEQQGISVRPLSAARSIHVLPAVLTTPLDDTLPGQEAAQHE